MFAGAWLKKKRCYLFNFDVYFYVAWKFQRYPQDEMGRKDKTVKPNCFPRTSSCQGEFVQYFMQKKV